MALDPILQQVVAQFPVPPQQVDYPAFRRDTVAMIPLLFGPDGPIEVGDVRNITIPGPGGDLPTRIYHPRTPARGTLQFLFGGGFCLGGIDFIEPLARRLARDLSMVVVTSSYRLAPENPFPAGFDDCVATAQWVLGHLDELGGEDLPTVIAGDSAGANYAAVVAMALRDRGEPNFSAQLLFNPSVDMREEAESNPSRIANADPLLRSDGLPNLFRDYTQGHDRSDPRISPLAAPSVAGLPPAVIAISSVDPLRDEVVAYADRLRDSGVPVEFVELGDMVHGFVGLCPIVPAAAKATDEVLDRLRSLLAR